MSKKPEEQGPKKLEKTLFIAINGDGEDAYHAVSAKVDDLVQDEGRTVVGEYRLVQKAEYRRTVEKLAEIG